jgi:Ni,Fe-hydrogenase maturation factor
VRDEYFSACRFSQRISAKRYNVYPENYLSRICEVKPAVIIFADICRWGGSPGEINIFSSAKIGSAGYSTHSYSVRLIEEYIRNNFSTEFLYICIAPFSTAYDQKLSPHISGGIEKFIDG